MCLPKTHAASDTLAKRIPFISEFISVVSASGEGATPTITTPDPVTFDGSKPEISTCEAGTSRKRGLKELIYRNFLVRVDGSLLAVCQRLTALACVGSIGSMLLFATLGTGEAFVNGRQFSADLGLIPKQYSSGGKANLVGISKRAATKRLRAVLIQGARTHVHKRRCLENIGAKGSWEDFCSSGSQLPRVVPTMSGSDG